MASEEQVARVAEAVRTRMESDRFKYDEAARKDVARIALEALEASRAGE